MHAAADGGTPRRQKGFRIGRVCTKRSARGHGHTTRLLQAALAEVGDYPCHINAQTYLEDMYGHHGFVRDGEEFLDDGIPHVPMVKPGAPTTEVGPVVTPVYPFSAIVGHDRLRLALLLCAVRPEIGGVLIRGEKGTAKSTAVRGLAHVLAAVDGASLVELPIGATEDRVVGSLDLQKVLRDGEHAFSPGLLARAHGGVLYVDEVNLLHDHLVDVILDAAAMGRVHVERDGVSHSHEARFVLIGTMNPEEGELRPQLLDRFGLTVDVHASRDVDVRADVIRQRMAFEADPVGFADRYVAADAELARRVAAARAAARLLFSCRTTSYGASRRCAQPSTSTGCGPIWWWHAPLSHTPRGVAHRRWRRRTFGWPPNSRCRTGDAATRSTTRGLIRTSSTRRWLRRRNPPTSRTPDPDPPGGGDSISDDGAEHPVPQHNSNSAPRPSAAPSPVFRTRALVVPGVGEGAPGRRSRARNRTGKAISATAEPGAGYGVHVFGTLLAAAGRQRRPGRLQSPAGRRAP